MILPSHPARPPFADHVFLSQIAVIALCLLPLTAVAAVAAPSGSASSQAAPMDDPGAAAGADAASADAAGADAASADAASADAAEVRARTVEAAYQFAVAKLLVEESSYREAQEAFERSLELDDSDAYSHLEVAKFYYDLAFMARAGERRRRQLAKAAEHAGTAVRLAPENPDVLLSYAQIHFRLGEHQLASLTIAEETFEKLRRLTAGDLQVLTTLGHIYFMKRQPEKAAEVLEEAASYLPDHRMIQSMLVDALFGAGRAEEAEEALARLVEIDPQSVDERLRLAELRSEKGDHRGAAGVLRGAPSEAAADVRLRHALARELHLAGDNATALATVDRLIEEAPDNEGFRRLRVAVLTSLARYREAIAELEPALDREDDPTRRLRDSLLLSRLEERVGDSDAAIERLRALLARSSGGESLQLRLALAGILERHGRASEAVEVLERRIAQATPEELAVFGPALAEILDRADRTDEALSLIDATAAELAAADNSEAVAGLELRKLGLLANRERWQELAEETSPLFDHGNADLRSAARRLHARALAELGRVPEALALLDAAGTEPGDERRLLATRVEILFDHGDEQQAQALVRAAVSSGAAEDLFFGAQLYQRAERYDRAAELTERLLREQPESVQGLFLLGAAQERLGRRQESIATFKRLLELEPDHSPTLNYLGYMWAERGENLTEALTLILRAVALDPDNGAYVDSLGWAYYQLRRYEEAREHLEWAVRLLPTDATIFEHLGDLYLELEQAARARDYYRQAVELAGDNLDQVRRKLEALRQKDL